jgi:ACS family glucarate transporter-like MFS transporter
MVTASLTPLIAARYGWTASFLTAAVLCFLGALAWLVVDPQKALEVDSPSTKTTIPQNLAPTIAATKNR